MPKKTPPKPKSVADFLAELDAQNLTVAAWARNNNFSQDLAYSVLKGRSAGRRGEVRRIKAAMGLPLPPMYAASTAN